MVLEVVLAVISLIKALLDYFGHGEMYMLFQNQSYSYSSSSRFYFYSDASAMAANEKGANL